MTRVMTKQRLERENLVFRYTGGVSQGNRCSGFTPAFRDTDSGVVYLSRSACGDLAPFHCLDGLPDELVLERDATGDHVVVVKSTVEAGFVRDGLFYTREQAADCVIEGE